MSFPIWNTDTYTTDFIYSLPEGKRAELIDGQVYYMAPPTRIHQEIISELHYKIRSYFESHKGSCRVYPAPFAVFLNQDNRNYVEPDISVICDPRKLDDKGCNGAPDWVLEIVSPSSRRTDYHAKLFKDRTAGVREYWIVDPEKDRILVYNFETEDTWDYTFHDTVKSGIYDDFQIYFSSVAALFNL